MTIEGIAGWVVAALALFYSIYQSHRAQKAEKELATIQLRGDAPYLSPSSVCVGMIYDEADGGGLCGWSAHQGNFLYAQRHEVSKDIKDGDSVILLLDNCGESARNIKLETDLKNCRLCREVDIDNAHGLDFVKYDFERAKLGVLQTIKLSFEAPSGFKGTHVYETIHGQFHFKRVNPE